jgi:hypothetical protein
VRARLSKSLIKILCDAGLGVRTITSIRSLLSNIFRHAVAIGLIENNPVRDARMLVKAQKPKGTAAYTLQDLEAIIATLEGKKHAQLAVALAGYRTYP